MRICIGRFRLLAYLAPRPKTDEEFLSGLGPDDANWEFLNSERTGPWQFCEECGAPVSMRVTARGSRLCTRHALIRKREQTPA